MVQRYTCLDNRRMSGYSYFHGRVGKLETSYSKQAKSTVMQALEEGEKI